MSNATGQAGSGVTTAAAARPTLVRSLGLLGALGFGLAYMMPMASFTTYGVVNTLTDGRIVLAYVVTLVAMLFTATSYASMAGAHPKAGAAYSYTRLTFGAHAGFLGGWTILLDYVMLPMMAYLVIGVYLHAAVPAVPQAVWILAALVLVTLLNVTGVKLLSRVSNVIVAAQVVFLVVFAFLALQPVLGGTAAAVPAGDTGVATLLAGSAVLCYSFLGFDAVASIAEETKDPARTVPRAIVLVTLCGGVLFIVVSWLSQVVFPDWRAYTSPDAAANDVVGAAGEHLLTAFFTAAFVAGCFGAVMAQQATAARVLFAMGRDGLLPRRVFGTLSARFGTPVGSTLVIAAVGLVALFVDLTFASSLINFGALAAFTLVNLAVIKHFLIDEKRRGALAGLRYGVLPGIGCALTVWLWTSLSLPALVVGLTWLALGAGWLAVTTRGFRVKPAELALEEE
jgi:putrescine importer